MGLQSYPRRRWAPLNWHNAWDSAKGTASCESTAGVVDGALGGVGQRGRASAPSVSQGSRDGGAHLGGRRPSRLNRKIDQIALTPSFQPIFFPSAYERPW